MILTFSATPPLFPETFTITHIKNKNSDIGMFNYTKKDECCLCGVQKRLVPIVSHTKGGKISCAELRKSTFYQKSKAMYKGQKSRGTHLYITSYYPKAMSA